MRVGVGWSTFFKRPWTRQLLYPRLRYAYRAPSFFLTYAASVRAVEFVRFDEALAVDDLDGTNTSLAESVDVLYLSGHGECGGGTYKAILHSGDWPPSNGIGFTGPVVAVFDTCDLVDLNNPSWDTHWRSSTVGPALRLLLGFASVATVSQASSIRGDAFARNVEAGVPIAEAWLKAVHGTAPLGADLGIAIAFGDDAADAASILHTARIDALPGPRAAVAPTLAYAVCH
jgi:Family of unknown function (DUF6345)